MLLFIALQNDACLLWPIEEINANVPTNERNIYNVIIGMNLGILSREVEVYKEIAVNEKYEKTCQRARSHKIIQIQKHANARARTEGIESKARAHNGTRYRSQALNCTLSSRKRRALGWWWSAG